jgi:hypothetical protein
MIGRLWVCTCASKGNLWTLRLPSPSPPSLPQEALGLLSVAINKQDQDMFHWLAAELEDLDQKWGTLSNVLKEGKTPPSRLRVGSFAASMPSHGLGLSHTV